MLELVFFNLKFLKYDILNLEMGNDFEILKIMVSWKLEKTPIKTEILSCGGFCTNLLGYCIIHSYALH